MPIVPSNPQFPDQVGSSPTVQSYSTQLNFRSMIQEVCDWNPNVDPMTAGRMINNRYRAIIRRRDWYGNKVRGQINVPNIYSVGTCVLTYNSPVVNGIGTAWTPALVGQQFRPGFTYNYQGIVQVPSPTQLILDTPFGGMPLSGNQITSGYQILQAWVTFGANIKRLLNVQNQQQGWYMKLNTPQEVLDSWDTWRTNIGWSTHISPLPPTTDGQMQVEIWPNPFSNQIFPFEAYIQPADMQLDSDTPVAWINSDIIVTGAISDALLFRPKQNPYYDPQTAASIASGKLAQYKADVEQMEYADNGMDQRDVTWNYEDEGQGSGYGSTWAQNHG